MTIILHYKYELDTCPHQLVLSASIKWILCGIDDDDLIIVLQADKGAMISFHLFSGFLHGEQNPVSFQVAMGKNL